MKFIKENAVDLMFVGAALLIAAGVFLWFVPAGFIASGVLLAGLGYFVYRKGE